jgi:predicted transposase YbfD/YdcC
MNMQTDRWIVDQNGASSGGEFELAAPDDTDADALALVAETAVRRLIRALDIVDDPRKARGKRHSFLGVLLIAVLGCVCGCDDAEALEDWAIKEKGWLSQFIDFTHGTPRQDVFLRVLAAMDPTLFRTAFMTWANEMMQSLGISAGQIAVDGQTHRGSGNGATKQKPVHIVSALACESGLVLGQQKTEAKSNEITAIPELLQLLYLKGALVSVDAMGCQVKIAKVILAKGGDYFFGLKGNQSTLMEQTKALFDEVLDPRKRTIDEAQPPATQRVESTDGDHGRIEIRQAIVCHDIHAWIPAARRFPKLKTVVAIISTREDIITGKTSTERRLYVSSRVLTAEAALDASRTHWAVENKLHWCLDVTFGQDANRTRTKNAAANLGVVRTFALNLVRAYKGDKLSIPRRRRLSDYKVDYREELLAASA